MTCEIATLKCNARGCVCDGRQAHFSAVTALSLTVDGWTLLSAARDKVAVLWDLRKYAKLATVPVHEAVEGARLLHKCAFG